MPRASFLIIVKYCKDVAKHRWAPACHLNGSGKLRLVQPDITPFRCESRRDKECSASSGSDRSTTDGAWAERASPIESSGRGDGHEVSHARHQYRKLYTGLFAVVNGKDAAGLPAIVLKEESNPGFRYEGDDLSDSERAGAEVWFKATGGRRLSTSDEPTSRSLRLKPHALPQRPDGEANGRVQRVGKDQ
jgi:hypothetical protein